MRALHLIPAILIFGLLAAGCSSTSKVKEGAETASAESDSGKVYTNAVHVLVDGTDMGVIPMTVRVRRSFGTREVSLWQKGEEIRIYELEISSTVDGDQTLQGFWSTSSTEGQSYDVRNLPTAGENTYRVPYTSYPIRVVDNTYGVTLLISN